MRIRSVEEITTDTSSYPRWRGANVSRKLRCEIAEFLGESLSQALCALDGLELSGDARFNIRTWKEWGQWSFSEIHGEHAPYKLFASTGTGDGWAYHLPTRTVTLLAHDHEEAIDLGIDVATFLKVMDLCRQIEQEAARIESSTTINDPDRLNTLMADQIGTFNTLMSEAVGCPLEEFPWPYRTDQLW